MSEKNNLLTIEMIATRLKDVVHPDYQWPTIPKGWHVEFIIFPGGEVFLELLNIKLMEFWSEKHPALDVPIKKDGTPLTVENLAGANIPFLTACPWDEDDEPMEESPSASKTLH